MIMIYKILLSLAFVFLYLFYLFLFSSKNKNIIITDIIITILIIITFSCDDRELELLFNIWVCLIIINLLITSFGLFVFKIYDTVGVVNWNKEFPELCKNKIFRKLFKLVRIDLDEENNDKSTQR